MGDHIHKPITIVAIVILLLLAFLVRARALFWNGTSRGGAPHNRRWRNTGVDFVPLSGVHVQPANQGGADTDGRARHHLRPVSSVTSIRNPPPAYFAHHLDRRPDGVAYGFGIMGHPVGSTVDVVPNPLPPQYMHHPGGDHLHL